METLSQRISNSLLHVIPTGGKTIYSKVFGGNKVVHRHTREMIKKLCSAGLGFYVRETETQQKLGEQANLLAGFAPIFRHHTSPLSSTCAFLVAFVCTSERGVCTFIALPTHMLCDRTVHASHKKTKNVSSLVVLSNQPESSAVAS